MNTPTPTPDRSNLGGPAARPHGGAVTLRDGHAVVTGLELTDRDTLAVLQQAQDATDQLIELIRLGARGWQAVAGSAERAHLDSHLERLTAVTTAAAAEFHHEIDRTLDTKLAGFEAEVRRMFRSEDGTAVKPLLAFLRRLEKDLDVDQGAVARILDALRATMQATGTEQTHTMVTAVGHQVAAQLDATRPDGPLANVHLALAELRRDLRDVAMAVVAEDARAREAERGTAKGVAFEQIALTALSRCVLQGEVEDVSTTVGRNSRVGDLLWSWTDGRVGTLRVVAECKTVKAKSLKLARIRDEAQRAISNRDAHACLYLVDDASKLGGQPIVMLDDIDTVVVAVDASRPLPLQVGIRYLQARTLDAALSAAAADRDDLRGALHRIRQLADQLRTNVEAISKLDTNLNRVEQAVQDSKELVATVQSQTEATLDALTAAIDAVTASDQPHTQAA